MTAVECVERAQAAGDHYQMAISEFIDEFRRGTRAERERMIADPIPRSGQLEGLVAGVVSALCRETDTAAPEWLQGIGSPDPFFAFPAKSYALRVRLMMESPAPFKIRNVFVPKNYLSRA
jgi:hypothetical protein